jgi:hypothetical protein
MSTNTNQIRPIFRVGTKDETDLSYVGLGHELRITMLYHSDLKIRYVAGRKSRVTGCLRHVPCDMFTWGWY